MTDVQRLRRKVFRLTQTVNVGGAAIGRPGSVMFQTAMVLIAAVFVGTATDRLAAVTGCQSDFIERIAIRCRKARLWSGTKCRGQWMGEHGDFAFMLDVMVATGVIIRPPEERQASQRRVQQSGRCRCGRLLPTDPPRKTCDTCRLAVKTSQAKRKEREVIGLTITEADPMYSLPEHSAPKNVPKVPEEPGAMD